MYITLLLFHLSTPPKSPCMPHPLPILATNTFKSVSIFSHLQESLIPMVIYITKNWQDWQLTVSSKYLLKQL